MAGDARRKMIESTVTLLAIHGLQGTALSDVLQRSRAPRGSIYHHFPRGKDELVDAAIELSGRRTMHSSMRSMGPRPGRSPPTSSIFGARS